MRRWTLIVGLLASMVQPALAFDDLIGFAGIIADNPPSPYVFDYTAPLGGFAADSATGFGPSDYALGGALTSDTNPDPVTGVDFSEVTAIFSTGEPPRTITVLVGEPGFADSAPEVLLARDFSKSDIAGYPVFARGEDYAVDLAAASEPDPFAKGLGQSQRLALGGDFIMRSAGWPELETALGALNSPSMQANLWAAIFEGLRSSSNHEGHVDLASGWLATAFLDTGLDIDLLADPASVLKSQSKATAPSSTILFPMAVFAVTQTASTASVQIALPYGDEQSAELAGKEIGQRLIYHPFTPSSPRIEVQYAEPYSIAVISIDMPVAEAKAARDLYARWMADIYARKFAPLEIDF